MKAYCIVFENKQFRHLDAGIQHNRDAIRATAQSMGFFPKGNRHLDEDQEVRFAKHFKAQGGVAICSDGVAIFPHSMKSQKMEIPKAHDDKARIHESKRKQRQTRRKRSTGLREVLAAAG
jgi:hypothetical protein